MIFGFARTSITQTTHLECQQRLALADDMETLDVMAKGTSQSIKAIFRSPHFGGLKVEGSYFGRIDQDSVVEDGEVTVACKTGFPFMCSCWNFYLALG